MLSYHSLPHWGRGTAQRRSGALVNDALGTIFPALFHTASTLSGSLRSPPSPRGEGCVSGIAVSPYRCLPHWGRGTASAVDRVLSYIVDLRRIPSLSFIPLVPYPARSARHLPLEGKALSVVILFLHIYPVFALTMREKRYPRIVSLPHWGRGTASAMDRVLSLMTHLRRSSSLSFIPLEPYPARSARHLPHAGKALCRGYRFPHPTSAPSGHLLP